MIGKVCGDHLTNMLPGKLFFYCSIGKIVHFKIISKMLITMLIIPILHKIHVSHYTPRKRSLGGGGVYRNHPVCLSVYLSVRPSVCPE